MSSEGRRRPRLLAMDTGGTVTDTFVVDDEANYTVGKPRTTPEDESVYTRNSFGDALGTGASSRTSVPATWRAPSTPGRR